MYANFKDVYIYSNHCALSHCDTNAQQNYTYDEAKNCDPSLFTKQIQRYFYSNEKKKIIFATEMNFLVSRDEIRCRNVIYDATREKKMRCDHPRYKSFSINAEAENVVIILTWESTRRKEEKNNVRVKMSNRA